MKRIILIIALVAATAAGNTPVTRHPDGTVTIDTSTLKTEEGFMGATPLLIHLDAQDKITRIEALPNDETPAYWEAAFGKLSAAWKGVKADKVQEMKVDAVSGATFSSNAIISNVRAGVSCYLETKSK